MAKTRTKPAAEAGPDLKAFFEYLNDISVDKGLNKDEVMEVVKGSLVTAYQKRFGPEVQLEVVLDREKPEVSVTVIRRVADPVVDPALEVSLTEARQIKSDAALGDVVELKEYPMEFSRVGAANVRQVLLQRLKELEKEIIYNEFIKKEGEIINGYFLRWRDRDIMYVDLGRAEGILPRREQIPGERFRTGDRVKALVKSIELKRERSREPGPFITLSRAAPEFVRKLFELEIPEIYDGIVEILGIVRQAGYRTKLLVRSHRADVDPVGACVGIKGVRIQSIVRELGNERIDIINYSDQPAELIANALSPARVSEVRAEPRNREALVIVPDDQYSLAIGINGHNVRLASQLTDYKLLIKTITQFGEEMTSPEARAELERIFAAPEIEPELDYTPVSELPGMSARIAGLLESAGIKSVEELIELEPEALEKIPNIGKNTARLISKILAESVEFEEE